MMWSTAPLGRLGKMVGGGTPSKKREDFWNGDIPWVSPKDMSFREIYDAEDHITEAAVNGSATQIVPTGSILMVVRSGILVRRFPVAIARVPLALNQDMKAILPGGLLQPEFLAYALAASEQIVLGQCVKRGATVHSVDIGKFQRLAFPIPAKSEQLRIVEMLDQANSLRSKRTEADVKATRILPALFYKMFGDPVSNSRNLPTRKLGDLIEEPVFGLSKALSGKTVQEQGTIPILRMANITPEGFLDITDLRYEAIPTKSLDRYTVKKGDLLFNWRNSPKWIGKTAIFHSNGIFSYASFLYRLRVKQNQADNRYIWQFLNALVSYGWFTQKCRQAVSQANFGRDELANIDVPYPQLEKQKQFGKAYDQWVLQRDLILKSGRSLELLFQTLLHRGFTGNLTAKWREAHMKELLVEMESQAKALKMSVES